MRKEARNFSKPNVYLSYMKEEQTVEGAKRKSPGRKLLEEKLTIECISHLRKEKEAKKKGRQSVRRWAAGTARRWLKCGLKSKRMSAGGHLPSVKAQPSPKKKKRMKLNKLNIKLLI